MLSRTENGALAFATTRNEVLDLFFVLAQSSPVFDGDHLRDKVLAAARRSPTDTLKVLVHARDCRGGKGIRCQSLYGLVVFLCFCRHKKHVIDMLMEVLPHFGRYRDVIDFYVACTAKKTCEKLGSPVNDKEVCAPVRRAAVNAYWAQLERDLTVIGEHRNRLSCDDESVQEGGEEAIKKGERCSVSLAAKWITSEKKKKLATFYQMLAKRAFPKSDNCCERFRKEVLAPLRRHLNMVETHMSDKRYEAIDYEKVPSNAMSKYAGAFARNDRERHQEFLQRVRQGKTTVKGGRLYPHDIVSRLLELGDSNDKNVRAVVEQLEHQWDDMVRENVNAESLGKTVVLSDVSSSMIGTPMDVSVALGILISEFSAEPFRGRVITFSREPKLHELPRDARLLDKIRSMSRADWGGNTDLMAVFRLILDTIVSDRGIREEAAATPDTLVILSDMQFDQAVGQGGGDHLTTFEKARNLYSEHGVRLPNVVFWNLRNTVGDALPVTEHETGACLLSGPSPSLLNALMTGREFTPDSVLKEAVLENPRYNVVTYPTDEL